jgi:hypothetical protein
MISCIYRDNIISMILLHDITDYDKSYIALYQMRKETDFKYNSCTSSYFIGKKFLA